MVRFVALMSVAALGFTAPPAWANGSVHTTYLWHLHQPIYWPDQRRAGGDDQYENAWDSIQQRDLGAAHPQNNLREIFGKDDRVAAYQWRTRDALSTVLGLPDAGAQVNYSGALMENVASLGLAGQLGYSAAWPSAISEARGWLTSGGRRRLDLTVFAYHHALLPLASERTQWLQIRLQQERMQQVWGIAPGAARGFFPPEMAFSERLIPVLEDLGIAWVIVSTEHLSRACPDFPVVLGSGGVNCDPPNPADQINPPGVDFWRRSIDRGCSPVAAYPFAYVPHRVQHVDPATGAVSSVIAVPSDQALSWNDGYSALSAGALDTIAAGNDPARPMLVVLAHDGDNAWGGGYSYYMEAVQSFCNDAASRGYSPSTVEEYLADHPVPPDDVVHVEDGAWVNADSDFGSPLFLNWLYPLLTASGQIDPVNGWHYKAREYAIFTAAENRIRTAENLAGGPATTRIAHVLDPGPGTTAVERAWHYYLASMDSGNVYYGNPDDMEIKGTVGCNEAFEHVDPILAGMSPAQDTTEPTIFIPQRHPWNPGAVSFGAQYGYRPHINDGSFVVWCFVDDVSGLESVTLYHRTDADGVNPLGSTQNETYAGGPEVGPWQGVPMAVRPFPAENIYGWGGLDYFELPAHIAQHCAATVPPQPNSLIDYYVEAVDTRGNVARSPIQHVWVGDGSGQTGGRVQTSPDPLVRGQSGTVLYEDEGGPLQGAPTVLMHFGFDGWAGGTVADTPMAFNAASGKWEATLAMPATRTQFDCVFHNGAGTWDNNGGQDWHFPLSPPPVPTGHAFIAPNPPTAGESALLSYEPAGGPLAGASAVFAHVAFNGGAIEITPDPPMDFEEGSGRWEATIDVPAAATSVTATFNDGAGTVDDQAGAPWTWTVNVPPQPVVVLTPDPPVRGADCLIAYLPTGRPLAGATQVLLHHGFNNWSPVISPDLPMTLNGATGRWEVTVSIPADAAELDFVFTDGAGVWDNNGTLDWKIATVALSPDPLPTGVMTVDMRDFGEDPLGEQFVTDLMTRDAGLLRIANTVLGRNLTGPAMGLLLVGTVGAGDEPDGGLLPAARPEDLLEAQAFTALFNTEIPPTHAPPIGLDWHLNGSAILDPVPDGAGGVTLVLRTPPPHPKLAPLASAGTTVLDCLSLAGAAIRLTGGNETTELTGTLNGVELSVGDLAEILAIINDSFRGGVPTGAVIAPL